MKSEIYGVYALHDDITFVMEEKFTVDGEPYSLEVKGFYYGEPDEQCNKTFYGRQIAHFGAKEVLKKYKKSRNELQIGSFITNNGKIIEVSCVFPFRFIDFYNIKRKIYRKMIKHKT